MTLGLLLDTDHAFVMIEMGPAADSVEVNENQGYSMLY